MYMIFLSCRIIAHNHYDVTSPTLRCVSTYLLDGHRSWHAAAVQLSCDYRLVTRTVCLQYRYSDVARIDR